MKIAGSDIKLAILDLDGTLLDSTGMWATIDRDFFLKRGMDIPKGYFKAICHLGLKATAHYTKTTYNLPDSEEDMLKEWREASLNLYHNIVELKPHVIEFLEYLKSEGIKISLATANDEELYVPCLKRLGIFDYFEYRIDVNIAKEGKHSPKIYDTVSEYVNIPKENTVVVEDILLGLKTAHTNGYKTIGVDDKASRDTEEEKRSYSDLYVFDLKELIK